jgi:hypothetical protein
MGRCAQGYRDGVTIARFPGATGKMRGNSRQNEPSHVERRHRKPTISSNHRTLGAHQITSSPFSEYAAKMTSLEMNKLAGLYSELDFRLEQGEAESPELDRLFDEVADLLKKDVDVWFHFDPAGMAQLVVHLVPEHRAADGWSASNN